MFCFVISAWCKRQETWGSAPPWLRVRQRLIVLRNLGCICNVTDNGERQFPTFLVSLPSERLGSGMIMYLLLQYDSCRSLTESLTQKHTMRRRYVLFMYVRCFITGSVFINRGEAGCDERWSEASHSRARRRVWGAGSPLQLHPHLLSVRYHSIVLASWFSTRIQIRTRIR